MGEKNRWTIMQLRAPDPDRFPPTVSRPRPRARPSGRLIARLLVPAACVALVACAHPRFPASGYIASQEVRTTVDSAAARDYLAGGRTDPRSRLEPDALAALAEADARPLSNETLEALTRGFSTDFAALYFIERVHHDPCNRRLRETFQARLEDIRRPVREGTFVAPPEHRRYLIVFVPGLGYRTDPTTGADFARQRRLLDWAGYRTALIETEDRAGVEANAEIIAGEIVRLGRDGRPIVLVSASKGGPEVALALGRVLDARQAQAVRAWLNVGGLLHGSPYVDWVSEWPRNWIAAVVLRALGLEPAVLQSLTTRTRRAALETLRLPSHLVVIHYVGVPLSGQVEGRVQHRYDVIKPFGPNDGLTLVVDAVMPDGAVMAEVGLDHYFRDPEIDLKTLVFAGVLLDELEARRRGGGASGACPQSPDGS